MADNKLQLAIPRDKITRDGLERLSQLISESNNTASSSITPPEVITTGRLHVRSLSRLDQGVFRKAVL